MSSKIKEYGLADRKGKAKSSLFLWLYLSFAILLLLVTMSFATQRIATLYSYNLGLGEPLTFAFGLGWYWPWAVFSWLGNFPDLAADKAINDTIFYAQCLFVVPQGLIMFAYVAATKKLKGNKDLHGSARWARKEEIESMSLLAGQGVYVGGWVEKKGSKELHHYLRHNGPEHILVFAPTRSGKGVGLILPTLLAWPGSSIVLDIKGENWALTSGWRKSQGHTVLRFDPSDASGNSAAFNPLEELPIDTLQAIPAVQNMASMLVDPEGKGLNDHWTKAAFALLSGVLLHCCIMVKHREKRGANLYDLACMLADESREISELWAEMVETDHEAILKEFSPSCLGGKEAHIFIASAAKEMQQKAENEGSGVISSVLTNLSLYRDPVVTLNTAKCDFRLKDLMNSDNPVDLFLVISPADIDRLRPLMRLMMDMVIRHVCAKMEFADGSSVAGYKHRLLLLLDEFTSLGKLPVMEKAIAYIAGYGGKMYIIVQDINQLNAVYGKENALMANCHVRIAYAPNTIDTAKVLSEMTGKTTILEEKRSVSKSKGGRSTSTNLTETARPLLTPDECMRLPGPEKNVEGKVTAPGDMLVFVAGQSPIYGRQILYFLDPVFSERSKMPAPQVADSICFSKHFSSHFPKQAQQKIIEVAPAVQTGAIKPELKEERFDYESFLQG